ncbi:hypothetical protein AB0I84_41690 [Streptomyces spectabilis]
MERVVQVEQPEEDPLPYGLGAQLLQRDQGAADGEVAIICARSEADWR